MLAMWQGWGQDGVMGENGVQVAQHSTGEQVA